MKLCIFLLLLAIFLPLGAQLHTRYTPHPAIRRVRRRIWTYQRPRWAVAFVIVRVV